MAKTALCIGINDYPGSGSDLKGCVNDARDWAAALEARGFTTQTLLDRQATGQAMRDALRGLVGSAKSGDVLVVTYSGHGTWVPDRDGDEPDSRDEALCPYDLNAKGPLLDDDLDEIFTDRERGVRVVFLSDSCHSGTVSEFASLTPASDAAPRVRFLPPETFLQDTGLREQAARIAGRAPRARRLAGALLLAGCRDTEYSYDASFGGRANGAFTHFALKALKTLGAGATYRDWYTAIRKALPTSDLPQTPNLYGTKTQKLWKFFE